LVFGVEVGTDMGQREDLLILAKTYPSPSAKYIETSCVAGINSKGEVRRIYPVPFRVMEGESKFHKYQWINARIDKSPSDHRPESYKIDVGTLEPGEVIPTKQDWLGRKEWFEKIPEYNSISELNELYPAKIETLVRIKPSYIVKFIIQPAKNPEWTEDEIAKLSADERQASLFEELTPQAPLFQLKKMPYDFYYEFATHHEGIENIQKLKVIDWEICQLFWTCFNSYGDKWEEKFRIKMDSELPSKDLSFFLGNQHRFRDQWLIISIFYPPMQSSAQGSLF
jgi:hypothetical protein